MNDLKSEISKLDKIANESIYSKGISTIITRYCGEVFFRYMKKGSILELGPAEGVMTDVLYPFFSEDYTIVDGGELFVDALKKRYVNIKGFYCLFEEFIPKRKFKNIILGHVLEHVYDPVEILAMCKSWLEEDGIILTAVPNKNSIHRQAAVEMGLLSKLDDFSNKDIRHGHRRVFDLESLTECFQNANLKVINYGGYWLKPISDNQIEESWSEEMVKAFLKLGEKYPDIAGEIYTVAN